MHGPAPYRSAGRAAPRAAPIPRLTLAGLSFGMYAFAAAAALWFLNGVLVGLAPMRPGAGGGVLPVYIFEVDAAFIGTALLCALAPVHGTRTRLAALIALLVSLIALGTELVLQRGSGAETLCMDHGVPRVCYTFAPSYYVWVMAHMGEWATLAWIVLEARRVFWSSAVPILAGAAVGMVKATQTDGITSSSMTVAAPMRGLSGAWFVTFVLFFIAFLVVARAARRSVPLDQVALDPAWRSRSLPIDAEGNFAHWRAVSRCLQVCLFAVVAFAARATFAPNSPYLPEGAVSYVDLVAAVLLAITAIDVFRSTQSKGEVTPLLCGAVAALVLAAASACSFFPKERQPMVLGGEVLAVSLVVVDLTVRLPEIARKALTGPIRAPTIAAGVIVLSAGVSMLLGAPRDHVLLSALFAVSCALLGVALRNASVIDREVVIASEMQRHVDVP